MTRGRLVLGQLTAVLMLCGCGTTVPGQVALGVTKEAVGGLRLGMNESQVTTIMGPALGASRGDKAAVLDYAYPGETKWGNIRVSKSGLLIYATMHADRLEQIRVFDVERNAVCICTPNDCEATWLANCEAGLSPKSK